MSAVRISFFALLCILSFVWALLALSAQLTRLWHHNLVAAATAPVHGDITQKQTELANAIRGYERMTKLIPCNTALYKDLGLLLTQSADLASHAGDSHAESAYLSKTLKTLSEQLACTPEDGKAWLDYAALNTYYEGFTARSLSAYKTSERVTPQEAWLAEKRLVFALQFRPLFDAEALATARKDIATLEHAHPNHLIDVRKVANLKTNEELYALFDNAAPAAH